MKADNIATRIKEISDTLPCGVTLIAVSKYHPAEAIMQAYEAGQREFGESKAQDLVKKYESLPNDIKWHFIGHLQTNKLKMVLPYVSLVQSVDSVRLLDAIESWAAANNRAISVLLEPHVAAEQTKQGFSEDEVYAVLDSAVRGAYPHIVFRGIMGMATFTDDMDIVRGDFAALRSIFDNCRSRYQQLAGDFVELSIGMSDDYPIAIEFGSTMVRIGSMIFGARV